MKKKKDRRQELHKKKSIFVKKYSDSEYNNKHDLDSDEFLILLKKHQNQINSINRDYIKDFIKLSNFLTDKKNNIRILFEKIKFLNIKTLHVPSLTDIYLKFKSDTGDIGSQGSLEEVTKNKEELLRTELDDMIDLFSQKIINFNYFFFHSVSMINSLLKDDMITFYQIYEMFDKLDVFNSNWEIETSKKLESIDTGIKNVISSIHLMEKNISSKIEDLTYITEDMKNEISFELSEINSSIEVNNFISGINTYQLFKINKGINK